MYAVVRGRQERLQLNKSYKRMSFVHSQNNCQLGKFAVASSAMGTTSYSTLNSAKEHYEPSHLETEMDLLRPGTRLASLIQSWSLKIQH